MQRSENANNTKHAFHINMDELLTIFRFKTFNIYLLLCILHLLSVLYQQIIF